MNKFIISTLISRYIFDVNSNAVMCDFIQNFEDYIRYQLNYAVDYVVVTITL